MCAQQAYSLCLVLLQPWMLVSAQAGRNCNMHIWLCTLPHVKCVRWTLLQMQSKVDKSALERLQTVAVQAALQAVHEQGELTDHDRDKYNGMALRFKCVAQCIAWLLLQCTPLPMCSALQEQCTAKAFRHLRAIPVFMQSTARRPDTP